MHSLIADCIGCEQVSLNPDQVLDPLYFTHAQTEPQIRNWVYQEKMSYFCKHYGAQEEVATHFSRGGVDVLESIDSIRGRLMGTFGFVFTTSQEFDCSILVLIHRVLYPIPPFFPTDGQLEGIELVIGSRSMKHGKTIRKVIELLPRYGPVGSHETHHISEEEHPNGVVCEILLTEAEVKQCLRKSQREQELCSWLQQRNVRE